MIKNDTFSLEWHAPEHEHKQRSSDWFWALGIITVSIVLVAILFGNIIFGILILVSTFALALFINKPPEDIQMSINGIGIMKDRTLYPFETLDTFWIDIDHPHKKIILHSKKVLMPPIIIPLADDMKMDALHEQLSKYIKEEYHSLPLVEKILEYLGF